MLGTYRTVGAFGGFRPSRFRILLRAGSAFLALLAGHVAAPLAQGVVDAVPAVDRGTIVDCKLPGTVRKLGSRATYLTPGRVDKLAVEECEVRGGEYVLFDRADPGTAMKIWRASAEQGDPVAQLRVGQIYEMGTSPDYPAAATWYRKAAEQGNKAASINLAILYEKGLGVPRDAAAALNLYRKAQGLSDDLLAGPDARTLKETVERLRNRVLRLEQEIQQLKQSGGQAGPKEQELTEARAKLRDLLTAAKDLSLVVDVGARAGGWPSIQLLDPSFVPAGNSADVAIRDEIKIQHIVGVVKSRVDLASLTVNGTEVKADRYGVFETSVPIAGPRTPVQIVAIDREGARGDAAVVLKLSSERVSTPAIDLPRGNFGSYKALIIGNSVYRDHRFDQLRTPANDADAVADILRTKYGFTTRVMLNATFEQTLNALNDYVKTLTDNDNLLIYYAGHGDYDAGRSYWIPVDAERDRTTRWILDVNITDLVLRMNARKVLVIADSCYSGALSLASHPIPVIRPDVPEASRLAAEQRLAELHSRTVLTSGGLQPVWDGGAGENSIFARAFLDVLRANQSILEGYRLSDAVEGRVIRSSQVVREREQRLGRGTSDQLGDQTPRYDAIELSGHQGGDFFFVPVAR